MRFMREHASDIAYAMLFLLGLMWMLLAVGADGADQAALFACSQVNFAVGLGVVAMRRP